MRRLPTARGRLSPPSGSRPGAAAPSSAAPSPAGGVRTPPAGIARRPGDTSRIAGARLCQTVP